MPTVILTREEEDNRRIAPLFEAEEIEALSLPMIRIQDLPFDPSPLPDRISSVRVLLTSRKGTERWITLRRNVERIGRLEVRGYMCVGERSAMMIRQSEPEVPVIVTAESGAGIVEGDKEVEGDRVVVYPCSRVRREETVEGLKRKGFEIIELPLYEPVFPEESIDRMRALRDRIDRGTIILFFSPSAVENFFSLLNRMPERSEQLPDLRFAALGHTTARTLQDHGITDIILPDHPTVKEMIRTIRNQSPPPTLRTL